MSDRIYEIPNEHLGLPGGKKRRKRGKSPEQKARARRTALISTALALMCVGLLWWKLGPVPGEPEVATAPSVPADTLRPAPPSRVPEVEDPPLARGVFVG